MEDALMAPPKISGFKTEAEKANELGKKPRTLRSWRARGIGPPYVMMGATLLYPDDNNAWLHEQVEHPVRASWKAEPRSHGPTRRPRASRRELPAA
jgi:hypothetical protein